MVPPFPPGSRPRLQLSGGQRDHGDPRQTRARRDSQFAVNRRYVLFCRPLADTEPSRDTLISQSRAHQGHYMQLTPGERVEQVRPKGERDHAVIVVDSHVPDETRSTIGTRARGLGHTLEGLPKLSCPSRLFAFLVSRPHRVCLQVLVISFHVGLFTSRAMTRKYNASPVAGEGKYDSSSSLVFWKHLRDGRPCVPNLAATINAAPNKSGNENHRSSRK